jgi:hypothetical protein
MTTPTRNHTPTMCECEHVSHFWKKDETRPLSPNGNPNHRYGHKYHRHYTRRVKTPLGHFRVCKDCLEDCMQEFVPPRHVTVVSIELPQVSPTHTVTESGIKRVMEVISRQGLIEPLCVRSDWTCWDETYSERLIACRRLDWKDVIVVYSHPDASS